MGFEFTQDQQAVIDHKEGNLLVSAAAGSGKTAVLVERIAQMALRSQDPVSMDRILVLTFTNAAARQMKEKIEARIQQALEERPEDAFLEEQYHSLSMASIMTNHAFCLQILQEYITRIPELDPGFRVADETEMELLRLDVLAAVLERFYSRALAPQLSQQSEDFLTFMDAYGGSRQDSQIEDLLLQVYAFMENDPHPMEWLTRAVEQMNPASWKENGENIWKQLAAEQIEEELFAAFSLHEAAVRQFEAAGAGKQAENLRLAVASVLQAAEIEEKAKAVSQIAWPRMSYAAFKEDPDAQQEIKDLISQMKKAFTQAATLHATYWAPEAVSRLETLTFPAMRGMKEVLAAFDQAYRKAKQEKNLVEFSDFEHGALRILQEEAAAAELRERYQYIFIDEYQDSNPLQEAIIERIARCDENGQACNVFMVGDVKQSIYRFRQADPSLFLTKYETYGKTPHTRKLVLGQNFRSERPILEAVNFVFEALMHKESGELEYGQEERLYPARPENKESKIPELWVLETEAELDSREQSEQEARLVAGEILRLVREGLHYRDIVILMRSVSAQGEIYKKVLESKGIPVYAESSENFYDTQEIRTMMNLLHIIDNPRQDIPLMGVLYSPIVGMSEEELGRIRLAAPEADFYDALLSFCAQEAADACHQKAVDFLKRLDIWRDMASVNRVHDLLWKLYMETGFYLYAASMPEGSIRKANLDLLLEKSIAFEKGIYSGLYQFLRYVEKLDKYRKTQEEAKTLNEEEDLVRIMTIHKSKGLEFPAVFVVGLGRKWNTKDADSKILLHRKLGIGAAVMDSKRYVRYPSMTTEILKHQLLREMTAEEMRLLYVAMTRAQSRLWLVGTRKERQSTAEISAQWQMPPREALQARTYLEWVERIVQSKEGQALLYRVWHPSEITEEQADIKIRKEETAGPTAEQPEEQFDWRYPYENQSRIPVRLSVSQIKSQRGRDQEVETEEVKAFFLAPEQEEKREKPEAGGADRGTAFHAVMAQANWDCMANAQTLEKELDRLLQEGKISEEEKGLLNRRWVLQFAESALYQRIRSVEEVHLEKPFIMSLFLSELAELAPEMGYGGGEQPMMIQGMIDCYFREKDGWILVDYKTDYELSEKRLAGYRIQLALYAKALENATGIPVEEKMIYDVRRGKEIAC